MKEGVVDIQNSDGQTIAGVVDIIGPANMKPITNDNGVWQGTEQVDDIEEGLGKRLAAAGAAAMLAGSGAGAAKAANYSGHVNFKYGSTPSKVSNKSISKGVDSAIKNIGSGKSQSTVEKKGKRGLKLGGGINLSMAGSTGKSSPKGNTVKPDKTTDPKGNKVKPDKTKVKPDKTKVKPDKPSTPSQGTNVLIKGSNTSSGSSTSVTKTKNGNLISSNKRKMKPISKILSKIKTIAEIIPWVIL